MTEAEIKSTEAALRAAKQQAALTDLRRWLQAHPKEARDLAQLIKAHKNAVGYSFLAQTLMNEGA